MRMNNVNYFRNVGSSWFCQPSLSTILFLWGNCMITPYMHARSFLYWFGELDQSLAILSTVRAGNVRQIGNFLEQK